jgi:Flp pilus assembly protein TadB
MDLSKANSDFLMVAVLVFVAAMLLFEGLYLIWRSKRGREAVKLERRLKDLHGWRSDSQRAKLLKQRSLSELPPLERMLESIPRVQRLDRFLVQSGVDWSVSRLLLSTLVMAAAGFYLAREMLHPPPTVSLLVALALAALPTGYVRLRQKRRLRKLEEQLPEVLDLMTRSLRAGQALTAALKVAAEEMPQPMGGEFRTIHDEVNFGVSLEQALAHLADRIPLADVRYFVIAVLVQRESGGNLTEILTNLSRLIRERAKLFRKVRVLAADGTMSAWIMSAMPFALAGLLYLMNPTFISRLWTDPIGITITQTLIVMMVFGFLLLRRIARIRV